MSRKVMDCSTVPSDSGCTLKLSGLEAEVLDAAVAHAIAVHGHEDTPEMREQIREFLEPEESYQQGTRPQEAMPG